MGNLYAKRTLPNSNAHAIEAEPQSSFTWVSISWECLNMAREAEWSNDKIWALWVEGSNF